MKTSLVFLWNSNLKQFLESISVYSKNEQQHDIHNWRRKFLLLLSFIQMSHVTLTNKEGERKKRAFSPVYFKKSFKNELKEAEKKTSATNSLQLRKFFTTTANKDDKEDMTKRDHLL